MPNLIGRSPNQVPVNGMLGTAAFVDIGQLPYLTLIATGPINGVSTLNITNIPQYKRLLVIVDNNTFPSSDQIVLKLSVDNGVSFPGIGPSVSINAATPTLTPVTCEILGTDVSFKKRMLLNTAGTAAQYETNAAINAAAVNAVRLYSASGQNFTGAIYYLYGEN